MKKEWGQGPSDNMVLLYSHLVTLERNVLPLLLLGSFANCIAVVAPAGRGAAALRPQGRNRGDSFPVCNVGPVPGGRVPAGGSWGWGWGMGGLALVKKPKSLYFPPVALVTPSGEGGWIKDLVQLLAPGIL